MSFVKLDCGILQSSLWREAPTTCKVFITLLAMANSRGFVRAFAPGISTQSALPIEDVLKALEVLEAPDAMSRTKKLEGRRIIRTDNGYQIVNYPKYRLHDHSTERVRKHRETGCNGVKRNETTETEGNGFTSASASASASVFDDFWKEYPRKVGKGAARKWWAKHKPDAGLSSAIIAAVKAQRSWPSWADPQYIPHPATWLNREGWTDERTGQVSAERNAEEDARARQDAEFRAAQEREAKLTPEQREANRRRIEEIQKRFERA